MWMMVQVVEAFRVLERRNAIAELHRKQRSVRSNELH
jgi:hypothetical protein